MKLPLRNTGDPASAAAGAAVRIGDWNKSKLRPLGASFHKIAKHPVQICIIMERERGRAKDFERQLPHDKRTFASLLGMTPENLSRAFNTLSLMASRSTAP
jgi:hypothetical protein